jgi:1-hydroxycarotenoid 3,4-desaturase
MATVIIGAGAGGLAAAIALAAAGEEVVVIERQPGPGGKLLPVLLDGRCTDTGPTVFTMMWVFEHLFGLAGQDARSVLKPQPLLTLARHIWRGGAVLDLFAERQKSADAIGQFAGAREAKGYLAFSAAAQAMHAALRDPFLNSQRPSPWGLSSAMPFSDLMKINPFETLWHALGRYFRDARLKQLFGRYATYCGSSPFKAPATLMLVADVEASGVWQLPGGMAELARALHETAKALGVRFLFDTAVSKIEASRSAVTAVIDDKAVRHPCDAVIVNADASALGMGLFGEAARPAAKVLAEKDRSLSAITWAGKMPCGDSALQHHNVFFSADYKAEFAALSSGPAPDPTVYVCDQGEGHKLVLVNAPANGMAAPASAEDNMLRTLDSHGLRLDVAGGDILRRSPKEFAALYPATHGALYGRASHGWMSTFLRPQARTHLPNLYLAGGSVHPGPGVPMATLSGLRAAEARLHDRDSTQRFRKVATAGGTSTP